ncbi:MAG: hypothetical protein E6Q97_11180 [Desulfurellales bacterium]|nr:MAG: hypothetical protein E6Q97_11180 [Desulfurellales bacterium]
MPIFSVLSSKIFGGLSIALAVACAYLYISMSATIASYEKAINAPVTGWQARLNACVADKSTALGNQAALEAQISRQNDAVERLNAATGARISNGAQMRKSAENDTVAANALVAKLEKASAAADVCASANQLILEVIR